MPAANIQIDKIFSQLNIFKNKANKLLVFYHDDERHSMQQVQIIFERDLTTVTCSQEASGSLPNSTLSY